MFAFSVNLRKSLSMRISEKYSSISSRATLQKCGEKWLFNFRKFFG